MKIFFYIFSFFYFLFLIPSFVIALTPTPTSLPFPNLPTYKPIPTGFATQCTLGFQIPNLPVKCAQCIMDYRPDLRSNYNAYGHNLCTGSQIVRHWCNGGLGLQALRDCNALMYGACNLPPDRACNPPPIAPSTPPTRTPTPPTPLTKSYNPRGCGILWTAGVPSCWCNSGGGQGDCGNLPVEGPGGCRDLCENGTFTGAKGYTHCYIMKDGKECRSNDDGSYNLCENRCVPGNPGFKQSVGCQYPNKTVFGVPSYDLICVDAFRNSSNLSFINIIRDFFAGLINIGDVQNFVGKAVRVPGMQKAECDPVRENCLPGY